MKLYKILFFCLFSQVIQAQTTPFSFEFRGGLSHTKIHSTEGDFEGKYSYRIDAVADYNLSKGLFLRSGLTFSEKNSKATMFVMGDLNADGYLEGIADYFNSKASYLQLPIMAGYKRSFGKIKANIAGGMYFAYGLGGHTKQEVHYLTTNIPVDGGFQNGESSLSDGPNCTETVNLLENKTFTDIFRHFDTGLTASIGAQYKMLTLNVGYELGLSNIDRGGESEWKNRTLFFSLGFAFPRK